MIYYHVMVGYMHDTIVLVCGSGASHANVCGLLRGQLHLCWRLQYDEKYSYLSSENLTVASCNSQFVMSQEIVMIVINSLVH